LDLSSRRRRRSRRRFGVLVLIMGRRRSYIKTYKCCLRLPTIEEIEEVELGSSKGDNNQQQQPCSINSEVVVMQDSAAVHHDSLQGPDGDEFEESCRGGGTWPIQGYALLRTKLAKLQEMKETLQPPARQLVEKMKDTCEDMMVFVTTKTVQQCRAVQLVWGNHQFFKNQLPDFH
jgi:hypothetical protein